MAKRLFSRQLRMKHNAANEFTVSMPKDAVVVAQDGDNIVFLADDALQSVDRSFAAVPIGAAMPAASDYRFIDARGSGYLFELIP